MTNLTHDMLDRLWRRAPHSLVDAMMASADEVFEKFEINTDLRLAHLMAQLSHESGGGTIREENLNYTTAARIAAVWPRRFTVESAQAYVRNPRALADKVYNGRMGNEEDSDDGWNFRGRGLIQITGREDYKEVGEIAGIDLEADPAAAAKDETALLIAGAYWQWRKINNAADRDDVVRVTKLINGGTIGLGERESWLDKWKRELGI